MVGMYSATQVEWELTLKINLNVFSQDLVYSVDIFNGFDAVGAGFYVHEGVDEGCGGEEADRYVALIRQAGEIGWGRDVGWNLDGSL